MNLPHLREQFHREREWPFSHENKWMAVQLHQNIIQYVLLINLLEYSNKFFF